MAHVRTREALQRTPVANKFEQVPAGGGRSQRADQLDDTSEDSAIALMEEGLGVVRRLAAMDRLDRGDHCFVIL